MNILVPVYASVKFMCFRREVSVLGKLTAVNNLSCEAGEGFPVIKEE